MPPSEITGKVGENHGDWRVAILRIRWKSVCPVSVLLVGKVSNVSDPTGNEQPYKMYRSCCRRQSAQLLLQPSMRYSLQLLQRAWCCLLSVPSAVYTSRQHPDPTKTSVFHLGRSVRSSCQTGYCWTSCFLRRWRSCLERSSCWCHFSTFFVHFPKTFKTASLSTLLSWPCPLN